MSVVRAGAPGIQAAPVIRLRGLRAAAAPESTTVILQGIDLDIAAGEQVAIIGASGSGKTTLLHLLACALPPMAGEFELFGASPWRLSGAARHALRAHLMLAPQVPPLPPRQRVVTAVLAGRLPTQSLWSSLRTLWHPREAGLAHAALVTLDLGDKLWERVDRLSGGERQRVGLARVLVSAARLWLIDEPLSALDPARSEMAVASLTDAARQTGRSLVCSLHQVDVARRRFPRIVALRTGRVLYDGPAAGLTDALIGDIYGAERPDAPAPADTLLATAAMPQMLCR